MSGNQEKEQKSILQFLLNASAGGVSAGIGKTASAPMERVKIVLQTAKQNSQISKQYTSGIECFVRIYKEEGFLSYWKGNLVNVIRYVPNQALNFAIKDFTIPLLKIKEEKNQKMLAFKSFMAGGIAGSASQTIIYPLDFVRTRLAVDMGRQFNGIIDCLSQVIKREGIIGVYRGAISNIISQFLYRGTYFGLYDYGKKSENLKQFYSKGFIFKFIWAQFVTIVASVGAYPNDTIKRKMMMQSNSSKSVNNVKYTGMYDCAKQIMAQEGYQGFFKGFMFNALRSVSGAMCLVLYDEIQNKIDSKKH